MGQGGSQVGREAEYARLASLLHDASAGRPGALLVAGEPGIGKTSLVTEVTTGPDAEGHRVLWGHCLRFGADSSPYLPIGQALTQWHKRADPSERARVLTGAEHLATIAPALGTASGPADTARVVPLVATVLDRITETTPLVLVIDDVQWADGTSLDLLAYLLAGFAPDQRYCLLITYRDTELGEGHRLHGWLADCTRLPSVAQLRLERLGRADTEALVTSLQGDGASLQLATDVFEKTAGNPYFTELLVRDRLRAPDSTASSDLKEALLGSWHGLGADARELLQLLALGGRPVAVGVLEGLSASRGRTAEQVASSLAEATGAGLTTSTADGEVWFHHPLLAEVIAGTLAPAVQQLVHRQYVEVVESATDLAPASRAAHLALHHAGAGDPDQAFVWSLRAADEAAEVRGYAEEFDHLHRACRLWEDVGDGARGVVTDRLDLWQRASDSAWSAGRYLLALKLREEAVTLAPVDDDPARAVRLRLTLSDWQSARDGTPAALESLEATRALMELAAARCPGTPEHAQALAWVAHAEAWNDDPAAGDRALAAVRMARRTGSSEALAWALSMQSESSRLDRALECVSQALTLAREVGDPRLQGWAATRAANKLQRIGREAEAADVLLTTFWRLVADRSVHDAMYANPAFGATFLVGLSRWRKAREVLRLLLSHRLGAEAAASTRGAAAMLALRTGDSSAGRLHLARARELRPRSAGAGDILQVIDAEAQWALGRPREALRFCARIMPAHVVFDPPGADELLVIAARSAGDLAEEPGGRGEAVALLDRVEALRGHDPPPFERMEPDDVIHPARGTLFVADRARCHGVADTVTLWQEAVSACASAGLSWHESLAAYQLARALLAEHHSRTDAASALRHARRIATDLGAAPIVRDCEGLARQVHVSLDEPALTVVGSGDDDVLGSLTAREREVLSHVVAGRTYAEIAQALVISEKTVSVHVSNLLRKTGTKSRVELADLVRRTSAAS